MRLNKLLASRLNISRRKADQLIAAGRITIADQSAEQGIDVSNESLVKLDDKSLPVKSDDVYLLINKPTGYICSRAGQGQKTVYELLPKSYHHLNPVGRLDKDSSGLLLMTNDGDYHNKLTHPSFKKEKTYQVSLDKTLSDKDQKAIQAGGVTLDDGVSKLKIDTKDSTLEVHMHEGRNRQVRRTFEALGYKVVSLNRTQFGNYKLDGLKTGAWKLDTRR